MLKNDKFYRAKIFHVFSLSDPVNIDYTIGCQILANLCSLSPLRISQLTQFIDTHDDIEVTCTPRREEAAAELGV